MKMAVQEKAILLSHQRHQIDVLCTISTYKWNRGTSVMIIICEILGILSQRQEEVNDGFQTRKSWYEEDV